MYLPFRRQTLGKKDRLDVHKNERNNIEKVETGLSLKIVKNQQKDHLRNGHVFYKMIKLFLYFVVLVAMVIPWVLIISKSQSNNQENPQGKPTMRQERSENSGLGKRGKWGQLKWARIIIAPPDEYISSDLCETSISPWIFEGYTLGDLKNVLYSAGLTDDQRNKIVAKSECASQSCIVKPDIELVETLNPIARANIYNILARNPKNIMQFYAFRRKKDRIDYWFSASGLSTDQIKMIEKLMYKQGDYVLFADIPLVCSRLTDDLDKKRFIKAISRTQALLVKLVVNKDDNIDTLLSYWGVGRRSKDLRPLFESLFREENPPKIDITHLLPSFVRARIYTFPTPNESEFDCNWTSMNFFNKEPDQRFLNPEFVKKTIEDDYYVIPYSDIRLGDLILFIEPNGEVIHSAVFIADDIVFTKNGKSVRRPWILTSLDSLKDIYLAGRQTEIRVYRNKKL